MSHMFISLKTSRVDPELYKKIVKSITDGDPYKCVQCGICSSGCPLGEVIRPHRIVKMSSLGLVDQLVRSREIWLCTTCFTCSDRCPQEADPANIIFSLKNLAARIGYAPRELMDVYRSIVETGRTIQITPGRERERERLGLPRVPEIDAAKIKELVKIVESVSPSGGERT